MEERTACAHLKKRFEAAGFQIAENQLFDEDGVRFEIDGFDAARRVGYEYTTREAGDGWDVDGEVVAALEARRERGELAVLIIDEDDAPNTAALDRAIDQFLGALGPLAEPRPAKPAGKKPPPTPKAAKTGAKPPKPPKGKPARKPK